MPFEYKDGGLTVNSGNQGIDLRRFVKNKNQPFYIYNVDHVTSRIRSYQQAFQHKAQIFYAMKANNNAQVLQAIRAAGLGVDVVSLGEAEWALENDFDALDIIFSGVSKTRHEIERALAVGIRQLNVESVPELRRIIEIARAANRTARVAFRMNPDVDADTHPYIKTGFRENKFGIDESDFPLVLQLCKEAKDVLQVEGLTLHIGSQIREVTPFVEAIEKILPLFAQFKAEGFSPRTLDIGGGVGISYESDQEEEELKVLQALGEKVLPLVEKNGLQLMCEPGRFLVARCGLLVGEVQYVKQTPYKQFVILNTGMHHLLRPSLYQAYHRILPVEQKASSDKDEIYDVVGPICESADVLGRDRLLPQIKEGDWLAIADVGAYGAVMSSDYNLHPHAEEFVVRNGEVIASERLTGLRISGHIKM